MEGKRDYQVHGSYSAVARKAFEVQKKCSKKAVRLEITSIFSIPEESARF